MSDVLDFYSEWGAMTLEELDKLKAERERLETASTIAPTDIDGDVRVSVGPTINVRLRGKPSWRPSPKPEEPDYSEFDDDEDPTNPSHYKQGSIELIEFIDDWKLDFYQGTILQYLLRWRSKGGVEDLKKAHWYLSRYLEKAEGK